VGRISCGSKILSRRNIITELMPNSPALKEINEQFRRHASICMILIWSFYETQKTDIGISRLFVAPRDSAALGYDGEFPVSIDTDHIKVTKFASPNDVNYLKVLASLKSVIRQVSGERRGLYTPLSFEKIEVQQ
jgi:hypothetical protein